MRYWCVVSMVGSRIGLAVGAILGVSDRAGLGTRRTRKRIEQQWIPSHALETTYPESAGAELRKDDPADSSDEEDHHDSYDDASRRRHHAVLGVGTSFGGKVVMQVCAGEVSIRRSASGSCGPGGAVGWVWVRCVWERSQLGEWDVTTRGGHGWSKAV